MVAASLNSASVYEASGKWAPAPAPRSIRTRTPRDLSLVAISGTTATRVSLAAVSVRTPTTTDMQNSPQALRYVPNIELWHKSRLSLRCYELGIAGQIAAAGLAGRPRGRSARLSVVPTNPAHRCLGHALGMGGLSGSGAPVSHRAGGLHLRYAARTGCMAGPARSRVCGPSWM